MVRARKPSREYFRSPRPTEPEPPTRPEFDCAICGAVGRHLCPGGSHYMVFCGKASCSAAAQRTQRTSKLPPPPVGEGPAVTRELMLPSTKSTYQA
jgi:hypothetical protein